jgi:hypothetical protein
MDIQKTSEGVVGPLNKDFYILAKIFYKFYSIFEWLFKMNTINL